jgi:predicted secreted hydrolase
MGNFATAAVSMSAIVMFAMICVARAAGVAPSDLDSLRISGQSDGFVRALAPHTFAFPQDSGPHPQFRHEWWYVTGNLDATTGERFGFELTFFRVALAPPGTGVTDTGSRWRASQIYLAHFAVTDVALGEFKFAQKFSRDALGLSGAQADPFRVWLDDWTLGEDGKTPGWKLSAQGQGYELRLEAQPLGQPVLNGEQGLSRKSGEPGAASYYYSIPRVAVSGRIVRGGRNFDVQGLAWLDREWGSGSLGKAEAGWDWFALQLEGGNTLMFYALRNHDGSRESHSAGTWVDAAGRVQPLSTDQVQIDVSDHWVSPRGGRYPSRWRVRVPAVGLDVEIHPALANQELGTQPRYWEGAVDVRGKLGASTTSGRGYVELVGYGE